ncbi:hypothetical protein Dsin_020044 [Dipteronia sinensis]|uniref:HAT C-terminal dimerisation domain-containing protein n=1 Tax=Dipteronia sinensis TaxID=43782 RepID=A0AAE0A9Q9_9ROSI|nr:hypothetical protein Dsin_020044 [Dipteronia sinensis]
MASGNGSGNGAGDAPIPPRRSISKNSITEIDVDIHSYCSTIKTLLYELYDEYRRVYGPSLNISVPQTRTVSTTRSSGFLGLGSRLLSQKTKKLRAFSSSLSSASYSEIETYHNTSFEFIGDGDEENFDILHWWRDRESHFPILAIIAKQILGTPVSTVAVKQEFSAHGNIMDPRRSLLSPESIQVQVCVDDWTKTQNRQQEIEQEALYDFFDNDHTTGTGTEGSD